MCLETTSIWCVDLASHKRKPAKTTLQFATTVLDLHPAFPCLLHSAKTTQFSLQAFKLRVNDIAHYIIGYTLKK